MFARFAALVLVTAIPAFGAATIQDALSGYHDVATALTKDNFTDAALKAAKLATVAEDLAKAGGTLAGCYTNLAKGAKAVAAAKKEADSRAAMSLLSEPAVWLVKNTPSLQSKWQLFKCSMVQGGAFAYWIQPVGETIANPYFGTEMLECGVKKAWNKFP